MAHYSSWSSLTFGSLSKKKALWHKLRLHADFQRQYLTSLTLTTSPLTKTWKNLLWSVLQWNQSCHTFSNEITTFPILVVTYVYTPLDKFSPNRKFVHLGVLFTWNHQNCMKSYWLSSSQFHVNTVKTLNSSM